MQNTLVKHSLYTYAKGKFNFGIYARVNIKSQESIMKNRVILLS